MVLGYHNVVDDTARPGGDSSLHIRRSDFARQLDCLARSCEVVPLTGIADSGTASGRPRVVITFDDAYRGALKHGVGELEARGLPATVFAAPALLGGGTFWWDDLAAARGLGEETRRDALDRLGGVDAAVRQWVGGVRPGDSASESAAASAEELFAAAARPGVTVGSHSWSHPNLTRLDGSALTEELVRPMDWLKSRVPSFVPWIAYPYGRTSSRVEARAREVGYVGGLRTEGGWLPREIRGMMSLPRMNVPAGMSLDGLAIRLAGLGA